MDTILSLLPMQIMLAALVVTLAAGLVKGIVGFAMPMVMISGLSSLVSPDLALAGLILPTVATNVAQALRSGVAGVIETIRRFRVFLAVGGLFLLVSAQLVPVLPASLMLLGIGSAVTGFAIWQLSGLAPQAGAFRQTPVLDAAIGGFAGFIGGMSGIWGPPTVAYLTAIGTDKRLHMTVQGVIYGLGAIALAAAHVGSGVLDARTAPFSLALIPPALLGMWIGRHISDRFDEKTFRRATLLVLVLSGLNLIRRGLF